MVRAGGGADAGDRAPAAARGWEFAGARLTGVPGLEMGCSLAWERASGTCNPPMWVLRVCGGYGGARSGGGGFGGGETHLCSRLRALPARFGVLRK